MHWRMILWCGFGIVAAIGGAWILSLPPVPTFTAPPIAQREADATLTALKPPKRQRPVIAIIGINDATEVTDYLMPYGILRRSDVADVVLLATEPGPVKLYPALKVEPQATVAEFDAQHPEGADYVIVPAMSRDDDPAVLKWLKSQAARGAMIIGVCAGAKIVGEAGLLDGKRATTHWYFVKELRDEHPAIHYVADRRLVVDQGVATTTGITASMPIALTLIEAIAGREKAEAVGRDIDLAHWDARHDSDAFQLTRPFALTVISNTVAFWNREQLGIELTPGVDEVSLALVADAWSRTYRSRAVTFSRTDGAQQTRNGIRIVPDKVATSWPVERLLPAVGDRKPASALDEALQGDHRSLRDPHNRLGRDATRISKTKRLAMTMPCSTVRFAAAQLSRDSRTSPRKTRRRAARGGSAVSRDVEWGANIRRFMRKLILKTDVSLDGYREGPKGAMDWFPTDSGPEWRELRKLMTRADTVILGRGMYAGYSEYWQGVLAAPKKYGNDEVFYARWADKTRHIVFSRTIKSVDWHMDIMRNAAKDVRALKAGPGKDIIVYGGSKFAGTLIEQGLVDEYYLHVVPVLLGGGKPLFKNIAHRQKLKQVGVKSLSSSVWLTYKT